MMCSIRSASLPLSLGGLAVVLSSACAQSVLVDESTATTSASSSSAGSSGGGSTAGSGGGLTAGSGGGSTAGSGGASTGGAGGAGGQSSTGDPLVSSAADSLYETRTDLKVGSNGLVVVTWVGHPPMQPSYIGVAFSTDGGLTFAPPTEVTSPGGRSSEHPTLVVTASNDVLLSWLGFAEDASQSPTDTHVYVARAPAGQTTFGTAVEVSAPPGTETYDRPRLGMTQAGTLIDVYERTGPDDQAIVASRSTDGQVWTPADLPVNTAFPGVGQMPYPCAFAPGAPAGSPFGVAYLGPQIGETSGGVGLLLSGDDGMTWSTDDDYADAASVSGPRCVTSGDAYWLAYGFGSDTVGVNLLPMEDATLVVRTRGVSLVGQITQQTFGAYLLNPEIVVDMAGNVDLAFYTGQADGDTNAAYRVAQPPSSPFSPTPSAIVHQPVTFALSNPASPSWLGDYTGLAAEGGMLLTSYVDNASGTSHVAVHRMALLSN